MESNKTSVDEIEKIFFGKQQEEGQRTKEELEQIHNLTAELEKTVSTSESKIHPSSMMDPKWRETLLQKAATAWIWYPINEYLEKIRIQSPHVLNFIRQVVATRLAGTINDQDCFSTILNHTRNENIAKEVLHRVVTFF